MYWRWGLSTWAHSKGIPSSNRSWSLNVPVPGEQVVEHTQGGLEVTVHDIWREGKHVAITVTKAKRQNVLVLTPG